MPAPTATMARPTMASKPMATAIPVKTGMKGNHSSKRPMVEEAMPTMVRNTGIMTTRAFPLNRRSRAATRPLKAPLEMIMPMEA